MSPKRPCWTDGFPYLGRHFSGKRFDTALNSPVHRPAFASTSVCLGAHRWSVKRTTWPNTWSPATADARTRRVRSAGSLTRARSLVLATQTARADLHSFGRAVHVNRGILDVRRPSGPRSALRVTYVVARLARFQAELAPSHDSPLTVAVGFSRIGVGPSTVICSGRR